MYILVGADIVPTSSNQELFAKGDALSLVGDDLVTLMEGASFRIFNLEVPLTDEKRPIRKVGPNLIAPTAAIHGYKALGIDLLTLANNHILDQDEAGLETTMKCLEAQKINFLGAGQTMEQAKKPFVFSFHDKKIGVYACAEHEFSIAEETHGGANPFDPLYSLDDISALKSVCDQVIVLYHGGNEEYRYPSPRLQKICRRMVEKGADLVVCQHSHCIGCEEKYLSGTIVYGQGNFLFDDKDNEFWQTSLLISIDESFEISYVPLEKKGNVVRMAEDAKKEEILKGFRERSEELKTPGQISRRYDEYAKERSKFYLNAISGKKSFLFRGINKLSKGKAFNRFLEKKYSAKGLLRLVNYIKCEAHMDLLIRVLTEKSDNMSSK